MVPTVRHSLVHATLLRIAVGAVLLIVVGTIVTYNLIFQAIEDRAIVGLDQYVVERAKRDEAHFGQIIDNLRVAERAFLERYDQPDPPYYLERWDRLFRRDPDGAWRSPREIFDGTRDTTLWAHKDTVLTDEVKRRTLNLYDTLEEFRPAWIHTFRSLWACTPEMTNIGFDPLIPNWIYNTPADWDQNTVEWVAAAGPERNPERKIVWTHSIIEEISKEYFVSVCLPVYIRDRHVATLGHDVRVFRLMDRSAETEIAGMTHMLVHPDGRLIAHPDKRVEIFATNGEYAMRDDPMLAQLYLALSSRIGQHFAGYDGASRLYYAAQKLEGPGWLLVTTMPRAMIAQDAFGHAQWVLWTGGISVLVLLLLLATTLRRGVAVPLAELTRATERLTEGAPGAAIAVVRDDELGQLAAAFNRMSERIAERDAALRELNLDLERRIAERTTELQSSEARVRAMLENAPEAIVVVDADMGRFRTGNDNALRFFGLTREALRQRGPADVSPSQQADGRLSVDAARSYIASALDGAPAVFEWIHRRHDGANVPCEVRLSRLPSNTRNLLIGTITDISERKNAEARLLAALEHERELSEMKTSFVSMVSHEFRTPLGIISSSAEILSRYFDRLPAEQRAEQLATIVRSTRTLGSMMEEVLLLGRFEAGRMQFSPKPVDLAAFARTLANEVLSATNATSPIACVVRGDVAGARSDEFLLRHILTNLLTNAVKYSPPGASVDFDLERSHGDAVFRVRDRGIGIPAEDMRHLFSAFRRGRNVGQRPGTGLGLVIVQRCVNLHGGELHLDSEPAKGTSVTVRLPVFGPRLAVASTAAAPGEPTIPRE